MPPQLVRPAGQVHTASTHVMRSSGQAFPHPPQLFASFVRRTHWPPQSTLPLELPWPASPASGSTDASTPPSPIWFGKQLPTLQTPLKQTSPFAHFTLQSPQFRRSANVSVQAPPHSFWPTAQPQRPLMHVVPPRQAVPHAPQLRSSLFVSTQEEEQFVRPVAQPAAHVPPLQTPSVPVQVVVHAPQFFGSFEMSTQVAAVPVPQRAKPPGQLHVLFAQTSVPPHSFAQTPQLSSSLARSTQDVPHFVRPVEHVVAH
jgi:hypothetical protein